MPTSFRWSHLVRHGLLGGSLLGAVAVPAHAEPCDGIEDKSMVGLTIGVDIAPKVRLIGGIEARHCIDDKIEVMVRVEAGGGGARIIGGARARPFEDGDYATTKRERFGLEAGLAMSMQGDVGAHLAASYGPSFAYAALQSLFPLTTRADRPSVTRTSLNIGLSPWEGIENSSVEGRPLTVDGRFVTPAVLAQLARGGSAEDRAVRDHFARSAQFEYSSVWTFLRLAAELAAVGAPARLVAAALDAADDEVRHAELCAREAGGLTLEPLAMLAAQPRFTERSSAALAVLAQEAWVEGCFNEGAAAEEARLAAADAQGPVRAMLATIARDEATHAALAWEVLTWIHSLAPAVVREVASAPPAVVESTDHDAALVRRGVPSGAVSAAARATARQAALDQLGSLLA